MRESIVKRSRFRPAGIRQESTGLLYLDGFDSRTGIKKEDTQMCVFFFGDPYGNRTHVTAVKGRCLNPLTNGP